MSKSNVKTILVTGGLGFIGKYLCKKLLSLGYRVISIDDRSTSTPNAKDFILDGEKDSELFEDINGTILDESLLKDVFTSDIKCVFHLAAMLGVKNIIDNPLKTLEVNLDGTKNVLKNASIHQIPTFIASSSEVYGKSEAIPFKEDADLILGPSTISRWGYAASKLLDEFQALGYASEHHLPVVIGRFFNIVGPGQPPGSGMVIPKMISAASEDRPLTIFGDGLQKRCFCHVLDCVDALVELMLNRHPTYGEVFNIGNPNNETSILELAKKINAFFGNQNEISMVSYEDAFGTYKFEDMLRRVPSVEKIKNITGWFPRIDLDTILKDTINQEVKIFWSKK